MEQFDSHDALAFGTELASDVTTERYRIDGFLGQGGFGIAYRAIALGSGRAVVVKEYLPSEFAVRGRDATSVVVRRTQDRDSFERGLSNFLREAQIVRGFDEESIVKVLDVFRACGTAYFVMPFEEAETLAERLKRTHTLPEEELRGVFLQLLDGLRAVHDAGYLHRDIKPSNILLRKSDGRPVLIDFGAARQALLERSRSISMVLTPGYAPPEQYTSSSKRQGPWTDLYAIGASLYRCISGLAEEQMNERSALDRQHALAEGHPDPMVPASQVAAENYSESLLYTIDWLVQLNPSERARDVRAVQACLLGDALPPGLQPETVQPPEPPPPPQPEPKADVTESNPQHHITAHRNDRWEIDPETQWPKIAAALVIVTVFGLIFRHLTGREDSYQTEVDVAAPPAVEQALQDPVGKPATDSAASGGGTGPYTDADTGGDEIATSATFIVTAQPEDAVIVINGATYQTRQLITLPSGVALDVSASATGYKPAARSLSVFSGLTAIEVTLCSDTITTRSIVQPPDEVRAIMRSIGSVTRTFQGGCPTGSIEGRRLADRACAEKYPGATRDPRRQFLKSEATDTRIVSGEVVQQSCNVTAQCVMRETRKVTPPPVTRQRDIPNDACKSRIESR
jgi:serine/threonine protein kinase